MGGATAFFERVITEFALKCLTWGTSLAMYTGKPDESAFPACPTSSARVRRLGTLLFSCAANALAK
jgi:hypothetical protein